MLLSAQLLVNTGVDTHPFPTRTSADSCPGSPFPVEGSPTFPWDPSGALCPLPQAPPWHPFPSQPFTSPSMPGAQKTPPQLLPKFSFLQSAHLLVLTVHLLFYLPHLYPSLFFYSSITWSQHTWQYYIPNFTLFPQLLHSSSKGFLTFSRSEALSARCKMPNTTSLVSRWNLLK